MHINEWISLLFRATKNLPPPCSVAVISISKQWLGLHINRPCDDDRIWSYTQVALTNDRSLAWSWLVHSLRAAREFSFYVYAQGSSCRNAASTEQPKSGIKRACKGFFSFNLRLNHPLKQTHNYHELEYDGLWNKEYQWFYVCFYHNRRL